MRESHLNNPCVASECLQSARGHSLESIQADALLSSGAICADSRLWQWAPRVRTNPQGGKSEGHERAAGKKLDVSWPGASNGCSGSLCLSKRRTHDSLTGAELHATLVTLNALSSQERLEAT